MLQRPSARRKSHTSGIELNLVPILDTMVTLIGFLLFTTTLIPLVSQELLLPLLAAPPTSVEPKASLELILSLTEKEFRLWSASQRLPPQAFSSLEALQEGLQKMKAQFPNETQVMILPPPSMPCQQLLVILDQVQLFFPKMVLG